MAKDSDNDKKNDPNCPPSLTIDWDAYGRYLDDSDLTEEQKIELIETLWNIVVSFVDLGFGVHPVQQANEKSSGQNDDLRMAIQQSVLSCKDNSKNNQNEYTVDEKLSHSAEQEES